MRTRSTWQNKSETPRQAATSRTADIYTMNQDHPQPSVTEYESGDPDAWAETPVSGEKMSVKDEYEGEQVKRNELGLGEFRDDTWKHKDSDKWGGSGKYDNAKVAAERKAVAAERVARAFLRTANESLVEQTAIDLMALPPKTLVSMLKRLDAVSPESMPEEGRLRRALACTKLAHRTLGLAATEESVEALARVIASIDDPTLKSMLKVVASASAQHQTKVAAEGEDKKEEKKDEDKEEAKTASDEDKSEEKKEEKEESAPPPPATAAKEEEAPMAADPMEAQSHELSPTEQQLLESMLQSECAPAPAAPAAPLAPAADLPMAAPPAPAAPSDDLTSLFEVAPAAPAAMAMAADISFDDDDGEPDAAAHIASLDDLFADDPEVMAQRQIHAAALEQKAREGGYAAVGRTASAGAKKLGAVRPEKAQPVDQSLETLWERQ